MKKIIKLSVFFVLCFVSFETCVGAASISVTRSSTSITKGNSVTITATVNSSSAIFSIEGTLYCSGAGVSEGIDLNFDDVSNNLYSKTYTKTVKPTSSGTITCSTTGVRVSDYNTGAWQSVEDKSVQVNVKEPASVPNVSYSKNNYLASLEVEGYAISPSFDKDTLEYTISIPNEIEEIVVKATREDNKAGINGDGTVKVSVGENNILITVTAENGNERVYKITLTVLEEDPVYITIDKKKYTVIRKKDVLEEPSATFEETTTYINDVEVLAYRSSVTKYIIVGLKDEKGNSNYYIYDNGKYTLYKEYKFNNVVLNILDMNDSLLPNSYVKSSFTYNEDSITSYVVDENKLLTTTYAIDNGAEIKKNRFYLFYAMNVETGEKNLYSYDKVENTVQRYNEEEVALYKDKADTYFKYLMILLGVIGVSLLSLGITLIVKAKNSNRRINR